MLEDQLKELRILGTQQIWREKSRDTPHNVTYMDEAMTLATVDMNSESKDLLRGRAQCRDNKMERRD